MERSTEHDEIVDLGPASEITQGDFYPGRYESLVIPDYWDMP